MIIGKKKKKKMKQHNQPKEFGHKIINSTFTLIR